MSFSTASFTIASLLALTTARGGAVAKESIPTRVLGTGQDVPGTPGDVATEIHGFDTNAVGGYSIHVETDARTSNHLAWGSPRGSAPSPLHGSGSYAGFEQGDWRKFGHGLDNFGRVAYSSSLAGNPRGSLWVDSLAQAIEGEPSPEKGYDWSAFEYVRITGTSAEPYFVGSLEGSPGMPDITGLFLGVQGRALVLGGDAIPGIPERLANAPIHFGDFDVSDRGIRWIATARLTDNTTVVLVDGAPLHIEGAVVRSGSPLPPSFGPGEWGQLNDPHIDDLGNVVFLGRRKGAPDSILVRNGSIVHRSGDTVDGEQVHNIRKVHANERGQVTYLALIASNTYALGVEDRLLVRMGARVDLDGDGSPDPSATVQGFGMPSLRSAPRLGDRGSVFCWLEVDVHGTPLDRTDDVTGVFRVPHRNRP